MIGEFHRKTFFEFSENLESFLANPENHFHDSKIHKSILGVMTVTRSMTEVILQDTWAVPNCPDQLVIRSRKYGSDNDDIETGKKLNQLASEVFQKYSSFLTLAKKTLVVTNQGKDTGKLKP